MVSFNAGLHVPFRVSIAFSRFDFTTSCSKRALERETRFYHSRIADEIGPVEL